MSSPLMPYALVTFKKEHRHLLDRCSMGSDSEKEPAEGKLT